MQIRVPVQNPDGSSAMPTKASRARHWVRDGKATAHWNDLGQYYVRLVVEPSGHNTQSIVMGIDPGKKFSGVAVQSAKATLFTAHLVLPFSKVTQKMTARCILRRARRGRRISRKVAYHLRAHRQKRFANRRHKKLVPSIRANRLLELRVAQELLKVLPVACIVYEYLEARGDKAFSPVMVGQRQMIQWLSELVPIATKFGWETAITREHLRLQKNRLDKAEQTPETHAVDGIALAATQFVRYQPFHTAQEYGHHWVGRVDITPAAFKVIARPNLYRRQLHFENPVAGGRKRKGGTVTPWRLRSGDLVQAVKAGRTYQGWIGGFSEVNKVVGLYNHNWHRIGQFSVSKVQLLKRRTNLCVT